jgi:hypothetical protein
VKGETNVTIIRPSVAGALTGAVLGGVGRAALVALHVHVISQTPILGLLAAGVLGLIIGGLAGLIGRPLLGAVVGVALSAIAYVVTYPIPLLFYALGTLTPPSVVEVLAVGGLAGAVGGAAGHFAWQKTDLRRPR